jgi:hypothetical protein
LAYQRTAVRYWGAVSISSILSNRHRVPLKSWNMVHDMGDDLLGNGGYAHPIKDVHGRIVEESTQKR